jgi:hypothetical protein
MELQANVGHVESRFDPFGEVQVVARFLPFGDKASPDKR